MKTRMVNREAGLVWLTLLLVPLFLSGCALFEEDESFDDRTAILAVEFSTHLTNNGVVADTVYGSAKYYGRWSPDGNAITADEEGIDGCSFTVNQLPLEVNTTVDYPSGYGFHWYRYADSPVYNYQGYNTVRIRVPSVDERHSDGYPAVTREVMLVEPTFHIPAVDEPLHYGDTLTYRWDWDRSQFNTEDLDFLAFGINFVRTYTSMVDVIPGTVVDQDTTHYWTNIQDSLQVVVREAELPDGFLHDPNMFTVTFDLLMAIGTDQVKLVDGKNAKILVGERRRFSYTYDLSAE